MRLHCLLVLVGCLLLVGCGDAWSFTPTPPEKPKGESPVLARCERGLEKCPAEARCDPYLGCVECLLDTHCAAGSRCIDRKCGRATTCTESSECAARNEVCALASGVCVACLADMDCSRGDRCEDRQCKPKDTCTESSDCKEGKVCDGAECVQCVTDDDCATGSDCIGGTCARRCEATSECRRLNQVCDPRSNHCIGCVFDSQCPESHHCAEGACVLDVCDQGVVRCLDETSYVRCEKDGSAAVAGSCLGLSRCDEKNPDAPCTVLACSPGSVICGEFNDVQTCAESGGGYLTTERCATDETCVDGECVDHVCEPSRRFCDGPRSTALCDSLGMSAGESTPCEDGNVCDPERGECVVPYCTIGATRCVNWTSSGFRARAECKSGLEFERMDDCAEGTACVEGECVEQRCVPGALFCGAASIHRCNAIGTEESLHEACAAGFHCEVLGNSPICVENPCTVDGLACRGTVATTCTADGSGPSPTGGIDCAESGQGCERGVCKPLVCESFRYFCKDGAVQYCNASGTASTLHTTCSEAEHCKEADRWASCEKDICIPSAPTCDGERPAVCDATGGGMVPGATDCASSGQVCDQTGTCAATAVDATGTARGATSAPAGGVLGVIEVRTRRALIAIEQSLVLQGPATLTFVVYLWNNPTSGYDSIFEKTIDVSGSGVAELYASGAIDVPLVAGRTYAVGVAVGSAHSWSFVEDATPLSFGVVTRSLAIDWPVQSRRGEWSALGIPMQKLTTRPR